MNTRFLLSTIFVVSLAVAADSDAPSREKAPEVRSQDLPIAEVFRQAAPSRIRIHIGGDEAAVKGDFFVVKGTTLKNLVLDTNSPRSPLRTTRLFCQVMVSRSTKSVVPWTRIARLVEGADTILEDGDSVLVWSLCFGP
jgi:hypothetical protein